MRNYLRLFVFVLALSAAYTLAQASAGTAAGASSPSGPQTGAQSGGQSGTQLADRGAAGQTTSSQPSGSSQQVDDDTLHRQVHEQLATNPDLQNVQVSVRDGVVELSGTVPNKNDKKEAKRLAKAVPGVKKVRENLSISNTGGSSAAAPSTVGGVTGSAAGTTSSAAGESQNTGSIPGSAAGAAHTTTPSSGTSGTVGSQAGATGTSGVSGQQPSAQQPSTQQQQPGTTTGGVAGAQPSPQTSTSGQSATGAMAGQTGTAGSRSGGAPAGQAGAAAGQAGAPAGQPGAATTPGMTTAGAGNDELRNDIQTAFRNEPTLTNSNVSINVTEDTITLSGTVSSGRDRETAERIARSFASNRRVVDNITVAGGGPMGSTPTQTTRPEGSSTPRTQQPQQPPNTQQNPEQPQVPKR